MAKQVGPWLAKPDEFEAREVRYPDRGASQHIPSGTVVSRHIESPNVRVQSLPSRHHEMKALQAGGVHVRTHVKYEEVYLRSYDTVSQAREAIGKYLAFYNARRPHSSLDKMTPDEYYYQHLPTLKHVA